MNQSVMNVYAMIVDLLLIGIFAITVYRSWKRGFVSAVAGLLSFIGAWIAAGMFSFVLDGFLQRNMFDPLVTDIVGSVITQAAENAASGVDSALDAVSASLESILAFTDTFSIPLPDDILPQLSAGGIADSAALADLTAQISEPIAAALSAWTAYIILFAVVYILLRIVFSVLNLTMRLPLLNTANKLLGVICGIVLGAGYTLIAARLLALILGILVTREMLPPQVLDGVIFGIFSGSVQA